MSLGAFLTSLSGLLVCAAIAWGQRPTDAAAAELVEKTREKALAYGRSLPDFLCTEVIQRFRENKTRSSIGTAEIPGETKWSPFDKLTVKLSYFQQKEEHELVLVDDKPTVLKYQGLTGGTGEGEFGATLQDIFNRSSQTAFRWESWKTVRKHRTAVFLYKVDAAHSRYSVEAGEPGNTHHAMVGFHGRLEIDRDTGEVLHLTYVAEPPRTVSLDEVSNTVDYDLADVGGRNYLLPVHSETEIHSPGLSVRNEIDFREYRKFSADSAIEYGTRK